MGGASTIYGGSSCWIGLKQTIVWWGLGQQAGEVSVFSSLSLGAPREGLGGHLSPKAGKFLRAAHIRCLWGQRGRSFTKQAVLRQLQNGSALGPWAPTARGAAELSTV